MRAVLMNLMKRESVGRGITVDVSRNFGFLAAYSAKVSQFGYNVFTNYYQIMHRGMKVCKVLVASLIVHNASQGLVRASNV